MTAVSAAARARFRELHAGPGLFALPNAWDVGVFDGYPATYYAALAALWQTVNEARAAGVAWQLVRDPTL